MLKLKLERLGQFNKKALHIWEKLPFGSDC